MKQAVRTCLWHDGDAEEAARFHADSDRAAAKRAFEAMMAMKKIDIATIEAAWKG